MIAAYWFMFGFVVGLLTLMSFDVVWWEIRDRRAERMAEPLEKCPNCGMTKYRGEPCPTCALFATRGR